MSHSEQSNSSETDISTISLRSSIANNWTDKNEKTLRAWKMSLSKALFVYETVLEVFEKKNNKIKVIVLILSIVSTIISSISTFALTNTTDEIYGTIALVINILMIIINAVMSFMNGYVQIYRLDKRVKNYTSYIDKLDQFYSEIANILILPAKLRPDALEFIKNKNKQYLDILKNSPTIPSTENANALIKYEKYLKDSSEYFKFAQKYNSDTIIDVA